MWPMVKTKQDALIENVKKQANLNWKVVTNKCSAILLDKQHRHNKSTTLQEIQQKTA